jgi:hypothetical protein
MLSLRESKFLLKKFGVFVCSTTCCFDTLANHLVSSVNQIHLNEVQTTFNILCFKLNKM